MKVTFWVLFGLSAVLMIAWGLDQSGDAATRGLGRFYALLCLPFVVGGLLLFLRARGTAPRLFGMLLAATPLLALAVVYGSARYGYFIRRHKESADHVFRGGSGKELGTAIARGDLLRIRQLIASGTDPNAEGPGGETPLSFALLKGRPDAAKLLLELGADATRGRNVGRAPIFEMSMSDKSSDLLEIALKHGASPDFVGDFGLPILQNAIGSRAQRNVEMLVAAGARLDVRSEEYDVPAPLAFALRRRLWKIARLLVEHGAPLNEPPGSSNVTSALQSGEPPAAGETGSEEYALLAQAMEKRGFHAPAMRSASRP